MKLFVPRIGSGYPLIILHGLYGSSDNWMSIGKALSADFDVIMPDIRNHGQSPHSNEHNYPVICSDIKELMNDLKIEKAFFLGHSMGGKAAMFFADLYPEKIAALIVVDISPASYFDEESGSHLAIHKEILSALKHVNLSGIQTRQQIESQLKSEIPQAELRGFLLKNLKRNPGKNYSWKINLDAISVNLNRMMEGFDLSHEAITGFPALFIKGENSDYIQTEDKFISRIFPQAETIVIPNAGHWLHAEQPELLLKTIRGFLLNQKP